MKILHVCNYYKPHIGGIEQTAEDVVNSLSVHEQKVICFNHEKGSKKDEYGDIEIIRVGSFAKISSQELSFGFDKALKNVFAEFVPDIVIFHFPNPFEAHYLLKILKKSKCRLIVWYHLDITKQKLLGKLFVGQTNRILDRADKIVATSPAYVDGSPFLSPRKDKVIVIPSCIDEKRLICGSAENDRAADIRREFENKILCFAFGRHVEYKGYRYLIDAAKYLDDNIKIVIGGSGPLTEELKERAEQCSDKVTFTGRLSDPELKAYLLACDIFCFPSITKNEAFGLALAEAMYFEKPAITFTIPGSGVNYVSLGSVTGIEVPNSDSKAYSEAISLLARDKELRYKYGKAAKKRVEEIFMKANFKINAEILINSVFG